MTFDEFQALAVRTPLALRNNRDRIMLPVRGLQEESGKIGLLLETACASGQFRLTENQSEELRNRLSDILWYVALLCSESGITMKAVATHSTEQLRARARELDPDQRQTIPYETIAAGCSPCGNFH